MQSSNARGILGWGLYCASSWTWCIGLFLPIIMLRLFGWPGFLVFAIPNLAGVILFGYLFNAERSRRTLREHRGPIRIFSVATAAYQLFFLAWAWSALAPGHGATIGALVALGAWVLGLVLVVLPDRGWVWLAAATWLGSIVLFWIHGAGGLEYQHAEGTLPWGDLVLVAPAIIFGFLLCPWMDGTFHRARIRSRSPHTFLVFAITFAPMLLFTVAYTVGGEIALGGLVLAQITMQTTITSALHLREGWLGGVGATTDGARAWPWAALVPGCAILLGTLGVFAGEHTYLRILGLYGLVFPAYALFFISPWGRMTPSRVTLALFLVLMIPCAVAYELAFVAHRTQFVPLAVGTLLVVALGVVFMARKRAPA